MLENIYTSGKYAAKHPTWDVEHSSWKAKQIMRMMARNNIVPKTICEVGCGAGEILKQLLEKMDSDCTFWGYEISPQAFELCKSRANEKLHFKLADIRQEKDITFDLILLIDVIEHLEDYFSFLREIKAKSRYKILHIPLELALISVLNDSLYQILMITIHMSDATALRGQLAMTQRYRDQPDLILLIKAREDYGHIHHFTRKIALQMLKDLGYEVIDNFYTDTADLNFKNIKDPIRKLFFAIHKDLAVRVFGRWSLLVFVK